MTNCMILFLFSWTENNDDKIEIKVKLGVAKMILIRNAEYKIAKGREFGLVGGPVHLGVGQEAIPVGISQYLNTQDKVFGAHRSHSHILSLGINLIILLLIINIFLLFAIHSIVMRMSNKNEN